MMNKKSLSIIGIMINAKNKSFAVYDKHDIYRKDTQSDTEIREKGSSFGEDVEDINGYLSLLSSLPYAQFYVVSCPNKEDQINELLSVINTIKKNGNSPGTSYTGMGILPVNTD